MKRALQIGIPVLLFLLCLLFLLRSPDLRHRLMGEPLWNFHPELPTDDPPLFKSLTFAGGIVRFSGGEPTEKAKAILASIPKLCRTFLAAPPRSGAITVSDGSVVFYPNCVAIGSRYYQGGDYPAFYERLLAFCEAHGEKNQ